MSHSCIPLGTALLATLLITTPAIAITKCKAKIDGKTGLVVVSGSGLAGPPTWGDAIGDEIHGFFNEATCYDIVDGKLKGCYVADPQTAAATIPPPRCTVYVSDGNNTCPARIRGCTVGMRDCTTANASVTVAAGADVSVTATCPVGYKLSGGGGSHFDAFGFFELERLPLSTSMSLNTDNAWTCAAANETADDSTLSCQARCCRMP